MSRSPKLNRDVNRFDTAFLAALAAVLQDLEAAGDHPYVIEGYRTVERQQYLYAQSRTRTGRKVTNCDGVRRKSYHQSGRAADVIFRDEPGGRPYWPPDDDRRWARLGAVAERHGLTWGAGKRWKTQGWNDAAHIQLDTE